MESETHDDTVAVITGSSRGIGRAIAEEFGRAGIDVALAARSEDELAEVASTTEEYGGRALAVPTDVTETADVTELFRRTRNELGPIDVLVNNAGITDYQPFWEHSEEKWEQIIDVNLNGTFRCCREALIGGMLERETGTIINMSSFSVKSGFKNTSGYTASKGGIEGLSNVLSKELADTDIRVSTICPASVETDMTEDVTDIESLQADDIAEIALFLVNQDPSVYVPEIIVVPDESIPLVHY